MSTRSTLTKLLAGLVAGIGLLTAVSGAQAQPTTEVEIYCVYLPTLNKDGSIRYILSCGTVHVPVRR